MWAIFFLTFLSHTTYASVDFQKLYFLDGCTIYSFGKEVAGFQGDACLPLEDGTYLTADKASLKQFKSDKMLWELPGTFENLKLTKDKKRILAISSDTLKIISLEGKVLHEKKLMGANSIYEASKGNILANGADGIFILSPNLKKIIYQKKFRPRHMIHDVQMRENGELIYFNNFATDKSSAIEQFNPKTNKVTFSFSADPKVLFFSPQNGSVQEVDPDTIFFSDSFHGGFFYSRSKNDLIRTIPGKYGRPMYSGAITHQIKIIEWNK